MKDSIALGPMARRMYGELLSIVKLVRSETRFVFANAVEATTPGGLPPCVVCGEPWRSHYRPEMVRFKNGPHGSFGLDADHTPRIPGVHLAGCELDASTPD